MQSASEPKKCPRCGNLSDKFIGVDSGLKVLLADAGNTNLPDQVCANCYEQLTSNMSQGLKLRMEQDQREKNKALMWKNRVHLIKSARNLMSQKAYSEAAVQYEKYIRVLEIVFNLKKGELGPAVFNNSSRSKEMTVVASVYWDLMRIYDTNPRYGDRMQASAARLAQFLPFSTIYPDIIKKAEAFSKTAKNPTVVRNFLRATKSHRGPCFIASAAFADSPYAVELHILRDFRDQKLRRSWLGRQAILFYYRHSPPLARAIGRSALAASVARWALTKIAFRIQRSLKLEI